MSIKLKRVYEEPSGDDGLRVLVDRLWPRGVTKERAQIDLWMKDIAPSPELRKWFGHAPDRFEEFSVKYQEELADNPAVPELSKILKENKTVTLVYAAHDPKINHVVVLTGFLTKM